MATLADIGEWFDNVWKKLAPAAGNLVKNLSQAGSQFVTNIGSTPSNPSVPPAPGTGGNGGTSTGSPSGGGSSSNGGGSSAAFFTEPIKFLGNLTKEETWKRVGIVFLGILLIFVATLMLLRQESPIAQAMRDIGVK